MTARSARIPLLRSLLLALACLTVLPAASASAATASQKAVAALNQVRAKVGVPAIANDARLAAGCKQHATWMSKVGRLDHFQTYGPTPANAGDDAGRSSVLATFHAGKPQTSQKTIHWLTGAPIHLFQMLHPGLLRSGYAYTGSYACMYTLSPTLQDIDVHDRTLGRDQFFTWPNDGARGVPASESTAGETPNPNEAIGLPRARLTGPYLLVWAGGFGNPVDPFGNVCNEVRFTSVRLTDPAGKVIKTRFIDDLKHRDMVGSTSDPRTSCIGPGGGGMLVAERPLRPATKYTATVSVLGLRAPEGTAPATHTWSFTTAGKADRTRPVVRLRSAKVWRSGKRYAWRYKLTIKDASKTTCTAKVAGKRVRCKIVRGAVTIAGKRAGRPKFVSLRVVAKDAAGNKRTYTKRMRL